MDPATILALLPSLISAGDDIFNLITSITGTLKQSGELTAEQSAALDAHIADLESKDWWKPDAT